MSKRWYGKSYEEGLSTTEVSKRSREQIKKLLKEKWPGVKVSIKTKNYSGGSSISATAVALPWCPYSARYKAWAAEGGKSAYGATNPPWSRYNTAWESLAKEVDGIINGFNYDGSEIETDYFDVNFYFTGLKVEWNLEAALLELPIPPSGDHSPEPTKSPDPSGSPEIEEIIPAGIRGVAALGKRLPNEGILKMPEDHPLKKKVDELADKLADSIAPKVARVEELEKRINDLEIENKALREREKIVSDPGVVDTPAFQVVEKLEKKLAAKDKMLGDVTRRNSELERAAWKDDRELERMEEFAKRELLAKLLRGEELTESDRSLAERLVVDE